ncbi:copper chaperone CopZ [Bacillaceae bacterium W0354]
MKEVVLKVEGMSCGHCVSSVKGALDIVDGINDVEVNLEEGLVTVKYDESLVTVEQMKSLIDEQGYNVVA